MDDILSDSKIKKLYNKVEHFVWVLNIQYDCDGETYDLYATGFSVDSEGLVMTCAHTFRNIEKACIKARKMGEDGFKRDAQLLVLQSNWDVALLRVNGVKNGAFGIFSNSGSLSAGQALLVMGHAYGLIGSLYVGRVAYPCVNDVPLPNDDQTCKDYVCTSLTETPDYRIFGHFFNKNQFKIKPFGPSTVLEQMHPFVPAIQCTGDLGGSGCSGGPILDTEGNIIGMFCGTYCYYTKIGIHVSLLKEYVKAFKDKKNSSYEKDVLRKGKKKCSRS